MAFSESQLNTAIDPTGTGRIVTLATFNPGTTFTDCYCVGVTAPYAGRSRWVQIANSNTPAQAWAVIQSTLA